MVPSLQYQHQLHPLDHSNERINFILDFINFSFHFTSTLHSSTITQPITSRAFLLHQGEFLSHSKIIVVPRSVVSQAGQLITGRVLVA
jgi:hypothetical protein